MSGAVDVVIVSYNRRDLLSRACASATRIGDGARLIVVDNASSDGSAELVETRFPDARVIRMGDNAGFGRAVNRGVRAGTSARILLLNSDAELVDGACATLAEVLDSDPRIAAVGPRIRDVGERLELTTGRRLSPLNEAAFKLLEALIGDGRGVFARLAERHYARARPTRSLSAACVLLRRDAFEQAGGFDERFFLYAEDVDLCHRLTATGWRLWYTPHAAVRHVRGASAGARDEVARHYRASQIAFYEKHRGRLATRCLRAWLVGRYRIAAMTATGARRAHAREMVRWLATSRHHGASRPG